MTNRISFTIVSIAMAALAASLFSGTAQAESVETPTMLNFTFERAALDSETGARTIYRDLQIQARRACRSGDVLTTRDELVTSEACARDLINKTVAAINAPRLTGVHQAPRPIVVAYR